MRRRDFGAGLGSAAVWPVIATAQNSAMPVIGYLNAQSPEAVAHLVTAFRTGLSQTGYVASADGVSMGADRRHLLTLVPLIFCLRGHSMMPFRAYTPGFQIITRAGRLSMNQDAKWMLLTPAIAVIVLLLGEPLRAEVLEHTMKVAGTTVHYKTVLPDGYDPKKAYPAILAFGGGPQDMISVDNILNRNFRAEAEKRGYIVVAPAAPDDELFFREGARIFPNF